MEFNSIYLRVLKRILQRFSEEESSKTAAAMAYYTMFSLFPLLIVLVTVISYFVSFEQTSELLNQLLTGAIPVSEELLTKNINRIFEVRNSVGAIGIIGFFWSSSRAFYLLVDGVNHAWAKDERRPFFQKRLFGLAIVIVLIIVLIVFMFSSSILNILLKSQPVRVQIGGWLGFDFWSAAAQSVNWIAPFLFFVSLYHWVSPGEVPWKVSIGASALITFIWQMASNLFKWYLGSRFSRYEFIFGSLSAIVVLLFWIYISSVIIFFGAHLTAVFTKEVESLPSRTGEG